MSISAWLAALLIVAGTGFFFAGTMGLLRFPDVFSRLHALTKADNTGLGLVAAGVALLHQSWRHAALITVIWLLALAASSIACHLVARDALARGEQREEKP